MITRDTSAQGRRYDISWEDASTSVGTVEGLPGVEKVGRARLGLTPDRSKAITPD